MRVSNNRRSQQHGFAISDLRQKPEFLDVVADRIWHAWWKEHGHPLGYIVARLQENLSAGPIPFALVAHDGSKFLGTASVIASDVPERPQYSPWIAAVWVEEAHRKHGVGAALVDRATQANIGLGIQRTYLGASRSRRTFYLDRGWTQIEEDVGRRSLTIMIKDAVAVLQAD